jgi:uncharacterized protein
MNRLFKTLIKKYQKIFSPILKREGYKCLFKPSCSQYALSCLEQNNWLKASALITIRLLKCNPINAYLKNK